MNDKIYEEEREEIIKTIRGLINAGASQDEINRALTDAIERGYIDINSAHRRIGIRKEQLEHLSSSIINLACGMEGVLKEQQKLNRTMKSFMIAVIVIMLGLSAATVAVLIGGKEALAMLTSLSAFVKPLTALIPV